MSTPGAVRFRDLLPQGGSALSEILEGLSRRPKELPPKLFYDEAGSELFERICELPEYYLTRAELQLMERHAADIAGFLGPDCELIEFGCGSGRKTRILIEALKPALFIPVDIASDALRAACARLAEEFPRLKISALCADYTRPLRLPKWPGLSVRRTVVYFPGSTIGNLTREEAGHFLRRVRGWVGPAGALVIGVDVKKAPAILNAAYNDALGVTAAFNLNLLVHLNRDYGADFDLSAFEHNAFYDETAGRVEMHLRAVRPTGVALGGRKFRFAQGELMRTEISCKYAIDEFIALAARAGFADAQVWQDDERLFAVYGLVAR
jgi:dimethylhistidine N-methyltransferase